MELQTRGKRARARSTISTGDRLSSLPDCLIHHIMSFMKARQVVQTCVLSTRWEHLWRSVPCLDIDQEEFKPQDLDGDGDWRDWWKKFVDFTDHLFIPNNISIALLDTFRLHVEAAFRYYCSNWSKEAARWIRHAIKYSTQEPVIRHQGFSPSSWRLKRLYLSKIDLDAGFMNHLSSGCPCLEDLELKGCYCEFHDITSHSLKNLVLKQCSGFSAITSRTLKSLIITHEYYTRSLLVITAPALAYLLLDMRAGLRESGGVSLGEMPTLGKALIHTRRDDVDCELSHDLCKLLCSLSSVTSLLLSGLKTMVPGEEPVKFPNFRNLRTLLLDNCDLSDNFKTLEHFLNNSPDLEKLTLQCCKFSKDLKKKKCKSKKASSSQCLDLVDDFSVSSMRQRI